MELAVKALPPDLQSRASLRGSEFAWPVADIPAVIEATKLAGMVSIGGQLQFRFPNDATCECYWVEVDTFRTVSADLPKIDLVAQTAAAALAEFEALRIRYDFLAEGRTNFEKHFNEFEANGGDPNDAMCFVWYVKA